MQQGLENLKVQIVNMMVYHAIGFRELYNLTDEKHTTIHRWERIPPIYLHTFGSGKICEASRLGLRNPTITGKHIHQGWRLPYKARKLQTHPNFAHIQVKYANIQQIQVLPRYWRFDTPWGRYGLVPTISGIGPHIPQLVLVGSVFHTCTCT